MDILELAVASGLLVTLDARIGTQEYSSVHGSLQALRRFAESVLITASITERRDKASETAGRSSALTTQDCEG